MMDKLIVVCGPTATGKTSLAIRLAQKYNGELVSADARQIYKHFSAGTGKQYSNMVKIWGYDLVDPRETFSVSQYIEFARKTIEDILGRGKLPILVGGTGFYIKGVIDGIATASIEPNQKLRNTLSEKSTGELYEMLEKLSSEKARSLNDSDRNNPRRLIRAIEVLISTEKHQEQHPSYNLLQIGLAAPLPTLLSRVEKNIEERLDSTLEEIDTFLSLGGQWTAPVMNSLGMRQVKGIYEQKLTKKEAVIHWKTEERKYVKRQLTWFKKDKRIVWFDIADSDFLKKVEQLVETWDNKE